MSTRPRQPESAKRVFRLPRTNERNPVPVPTHLQNYVKAGSLKADADGIVHSFLLAADGCDRFRIRYYGGFHMGWITATDTAPAKIVAVEPQSGREILLFDGAQHGYNAMFCDEYGEEQIRNRALAELDGSSYQIRVSLFYDIDYADERDDFADEHGNVALIDGRIIPFAQLQQDGFDGISIDLVDEEGNARSLVSEELA